MMAQVNFKIPAHGGQVCGIEAENLPAKSHGAFEINFRRNNAVSGATSPQDIVVKASIMRNREIDIFEEGLDIFPLLSEIRLIGDIFPGKPMKITENKIPIRRADKKRGLLDDGVMLHPNQPQRAGAVPIIICGFKIKCQKIHDKILLLLQFIPKLINDHVSKATLFRPDIFAR
ncbi:MAG TPA: hypothetical protein P5040_00820 [Smithella sp.]|nr:hypothetical protein [Smithella sp.]